MLMLSNRNLSTGVGPRRHKVGVGVRWWQSELQSWCPHHFEATFICLPVGHVDRITIPSTRFEALLTLLRVNHCIDQPDATTDDDDRSNQEKDIRSATVTFIIVFVKLLLFLRHIDQSTIPNRSLAMVAAI